MNDLEWPILSYFVIYYETLKKVIQWTVNETLNNMVVLNDDRIPNRIVINNHVT